MTETPKVGLKLKFYENLIVSPFLNKSLPPGVQAKRKKLWGQICPPPRVLKGPKYLIGLSLHAPGCDCPLQPLKFCTFSEI